MAVRPTQSIAVGTTAVALAPATAPTDRVAGSSVLLVNTGSATVFLGDASVTSASGFPWTTAVGPLAFDLQPGEIIYGICAAATSSTVGVLETGV